MIEADRSPFWDPLLFVALQWQLKNAFFSIHASGLENLRTLDPEKPVIAFSNYTNWWDGLIVFHLTRQARKKRFYCMLDEKQMKDYRFFKWLGAFSVDKGNPVRAAASVRYATRLLENPETLLWLFPQGKISSPHEPVTVETGTEYLASRARRAQLLPVAFGYTFRREDRPEVFIRFGKGFLSSECYEGRISEEIQQQSDFVQNAIHENDYHDFTRLLTPKLSLNKRFEWVRRLFTGTLRDFCAEN